LNLRLVTYYNTNPHWDNLTYTSGPHGDIGQDQLFC